MKKYVVEQGFGKEKGQLQAARLGVLRQRYWGEPIPW